MATYNEPFDYKKAQNAQQANEAIDRHRRGKLAEKMTRPKAAAAGAPKPVQRPGVGAKLGNAAVKVGQTLTRPRVTPTWGGVIKTGAGVLAKGASKALSIPYQAAGTVGYYAGDALKDTAAAKTMQRPVTNAMASVSGLNDLESRAMSDDPVVARAAQAEHRAKYPPTYNGVNGPGTQPARQQAEQIARPGAAPAVAPNPEAAVDAYTTGNSAPSNPQMNAARPKPIPNSEYSYAGRQEGGAEVITRPTTGADGSPVIDPGTGRPVPEFTDNYTAFDKLRPAQSAESIAAEEARAAAARQQYAQNTTGSDGRRFYGGPETEKLRAAQNAAVARGDTSTVTQQLADEGLTPEQRAAYKADPTGAYQVDAQASTASNKAQLDAFKAQQDMARNSRTDARLNRSAAMKEMGSALAQFKDNPAYAQLSALAEEIYDPSSGESMTSIVSQMLASIETDALGNPRLNDTGGVIFKPIDTTDQTEEAEKKPTVASIIDAFF